MLATSDTSKLQAPDFSHGEADSTTFLPMRLINIQLALWEVTHFHVSGFSALGHAILVTRSAGHMIMFIAKLTVAL